MNPSSVQFIVTKANTHKLINIVYLLGIVQMFTGPRYSTMHIIDNGSVSDILFAVSGYLTPDLVLVIAKQLAVLSFLVQIENLTRLSLGTKSIRDYQI